MASWIGRTAVARASGMRVPHGSAGRDPRPNGVVDLTAETAASILDAMSRAVATVYPDWPQHARRIRDAVVGRGAHLAWALDASFEVVADVLARWTVEGLSLTAERRWGDTVQVHTRASVISRSPSHDAFHAGEVSQPLGLHEAASIDPWRRTPPT